MPGQADRADSANTADAPVTHLLYLHGFRSSPGSTKARQMAAWVAAHQPQLSWHCPQLPPSPAAALSLIEDLTRAWPPASRAVIGSSLGGFYATVLAERIGCRSVLINPAVNPARDLASQIGETTTWHSGEAMFFEPRYIGELAAMTPPVLRQQHRCMALIAQGDEVLDWREMASRHAGAQLTVLEGGDHALSDFAQHIPAIARFFGWGDPKA
jgi:uncharacterized protein